MRPSNLLRGVALVGTAHRRWEQFQRAGSQITEQRVQDGNAIAKTVRGLFYRQLIDHDRADSFVLALSRACGLVEKRLEIGHGSGIIGDE